MTGLGFCCKDWRRWAWNDAEFIPGVLLKVHGKATAVVKVLRDPGTSVSWDPDAAIHHMFTPAAGPWQKEDMLGWENDSGVFKALEVAAREGREETVKLLLV